MTGVFAASLLAALIAAPPGAQRAPVLQAGAWMTHGPQGALHLFADPRAPRAVYAATGQGIFESVDEGASWAPRSGGLSDLPALLILGLDDPPTLYGWNLSEFFRSLDGGLTWTSFASGRRLLAVDPTLPRRVFAQSESFDVSCSLDVSTDAGDTWSSVFECPPESGISSLVFDPQDPRNVYVGFDGGSQFHVYKSVDAGQSWFPSDQGETDVVAGLLVDPGDPRVIYAFGSRTIFKSSDGAATWRESTPLPQILEITSLAFDPADGSVYAATYNGLFRSVGAEAPWSLVSALDLSELTIFDDPSAPFLARDFDRILRSTDRGASWTDTDAGLYGASVLALAMDPSSALFAATSNEVFESDDGGQSWSGRPYAFPNASQIAELVAVSSPRVLYAGTSGDGVRASNDGGGSWYTVGTGLSSTPINRLVRTPSGILVAGGGSGVYGPDPYGVWKSQNDGLNSTSITALVAAPSADGVIYAGTSLGGVFRSTNSGRDWSPAGLDGSFIEDLAVDPNDDGVLYASTSSLDEFPKLQKSTDSGQTWSSLVGLPTTNGFGCLAVDPSDSETVYACTLQGLFRSTDGGLSWVPFDQGIPFSPLITRILIEPDGTRLHAATGRLGVLDRTIGQRASRTLAPR